MMRHASSARCASARSSHPCGDRHSRLRLALKLSITALSIGLPGRLKSSVMPDARGARAGAGMFAPASASHRVGPRGPLPGRSGYTGPYWMARRREASLTLRQGGQHQSASNFVSAGHADSAELRQNRADLRQPEASESWLSPLEAGLHRCAAGHAPRRHCAHRLTEAAAGGCDSGPGAPQAGTRRGGTKAGDMRS